MCLYGPFQASQQLLRSSGASGACSSATTTFEEALKSSGTSEVGVGRGIRHPHPVGLKVVTVQGKRVGWRCANGTWSQYPPTRCSNGKLVVSIKFPFCSDGNLDSADHRSHMVYPVMQSDGTLQCPSTHPTAVPRLQPNIQLPIPTTSGTVKLSSGDPSTMHADFFNAWEEGRLAELVERCINAAPFTASNPKPAEC